MGFLSLYNKDNRDKDIFKNMLWDKTVIDVLYADVIFESTDFQWLESYLPFMAKNGVIQIHTDWHTSAEWYLYLKKSLGLIPINWCISIQEWGGISQKYFPRKHDDILIFGMSDTWTFNPERIKNKKDYSRYSP